MKLVEASLTAFKEPKVGEMLSGPRNVAPRVLKIARESAIRPVDAFDASRVPDSQRTRRHVRPG